ncbi:hypothetical protein CYMTET_30975 [Cymbomonas tetramitiformis]|uniref:Uncharacterized protein n=1 Tax=Cymbomonas tetramitiformis TaxID=36881 RepID=A0AAE0FIA7_9CHLO|nr:hypothetical protein CYMTET_30975 [Cymbomonas tetramitiformis]
MPPTAVGVEPTCKLLAAVVRGQSTQCRRRHAGPARTWELSSSYSRMSSNAGTPRMMGTGGAAGRPSGASPRCPAGAARWNLSAEKWISAGWEGTSTGDGTGITNREDGVGVNPGAQEGKSAERCGGPQPLVGADHHDLHRSAGIAPAVSHYTGECIHQL